MSVLSGTTRPDPGSIHGQPSDLCSCEVHRLPSPVGEIVLVRVRGEIDIYTVDVVGDALSGVLCRSPAHLVVDLSGTTFCGLRGLALIVTSAAAAAGRDAGFSVCGASAQAQRLWSTLWSAAERPICHVDAVAGVRAARQSQARRGAGGRSWRQYGAGTTVPSPEVPARRRSPAR